MPVTWPGGKVRETGVECKREKGEMLADFFLRVLRQNRAQRQERPEYIDPEEKHASLSLLNHNKCHWMPDWNAT